MHDCCVIITSLLRPTLEQAVLSVYRQQFEGSIQVLIGVDHDGPVSAEASAMLERLRRACPPGRTLTVLELGYSTARIHGGLYNNACGGMLPTMASFAADSRYLAYLDDDDWFGPEHLGTLMAAVAGRPWAFSLSWYVNPANDEPMCIDRLESAGPGRGAYHQRFGGFTRPSCLMIDKLQCADILHVWGASDFDGGRGTDRAFFAALSARRPGWGATGLASAYCRLVPTDANHAHRLVYARAMAYAIERVPGHEQVEALRQTGEQYLAVASVLDEVMRG